MPPSNRMWTCNRASIDVVVEMRRSVSKRGAIARSPRASPIPQEKFDRDEMRAGAKQQPCRWLMSLQTDLSIGVTEGTEGTGSHGGAEKRRRINAGIAGIAGGCGAGWTPALQVHPAPPRSLRSPR